MLSSQETTQLRDVGTRTSPTQTSSGQSITQYSFKDKPQIFDLVKPELSDVHEKVKDS